jgi:hypothetical protein
VCYLDYDSGWARAFGPEPDIYHDYRGTSANHGPCNDMCMGHVLYSESADPYITGHGRAVNILPNRINVLLVLCIVRICVTPKLRHRIIRCFHNYRARIPRRKGRPGGRPAAGAASGGDPIRPAGRRGAQGRPAPAPRAGGAGAAALAGAAGGLAGDRTGARKPGRGRSGAGGGPRRRRRAAGGGRRAARERMPALALWMRLQEL